MKIILLPAILIIAFGMLSMGQYQSPTTSTSSSYSAFPSPFNILSLSQDPDSDIAQIVALQEEQAQYEQY